MFPIYEVTAIWEGKRVFKATGPSGFPIRMDATELYGGDHSGNTPMELLLAGLIGCMGIDVTMILDRMRQPIDSLQMKAEGHRKETLPTGFHAIDLSFYVSGKVTAAKLWRAILLGKKKYCAVSDSLNAEIRLHLYLNGQKAEPPLNLELDEEKLNQE